MDPMELLRNARSRRDATYRSDALLVVQGFQGHYFKIYGPTAQIDFDKDLLECVADLFLEVEYSVYGKPRVDVLEEMAEARGEQLLEVLQGVNGWCIIE